MTDQTFEEFVTKERERLTQERERLFDQQHEIEQRLTAINAEMNAINAYQAVKEGKPVQAAPAPRPEKARAPKAADAPRRARGEGGVRQQVIDLVRKAGDGGITSGDITSALQMDDKAGRQAVANALMSLKKEGSVQQAGRRQPYTATEHPERD